MPEPVLVDGAIMVEVNAVAAAGSWTAKIFSEHISSNLVLVNSTQVNPEKWVLYFNVSGAVTPGLYSLNLAYTVGEETVNCTQNRCIWVLEDWPEELTIGQISDTHLPYGADDFARFVYEINLIQPDLVFHTGDVVDTETLANGWTYFQEILNRLEIPSFFLPGNHDHKGANGELYQKYCGLLNYSVVIGDFLFVALDAGDPGFVPLNQLEWAESVLQRYPEKVKIIGVHHPLFSLLPGRNITGSWENIEGLTSYLYFSWLNNLNESRAFLRLVEEYDVRLILSGHVHQNVFYVYNNRHYFVTTGPCGGSLREGGFPGYKLIWIDKEGNLKFDAYTMADLSDDMNYIPVGNVVYYYSQANDGTKSAVSATVINNQIQELTDARLEFVVNSACDIDDYEFYLSQPDNYETFTYVDGHHFIAHIDVPPQSSLFITLAAISDTEDPTINVEVQGEIKEETPILFLIEASDAEWGVKTVKASYTINGEETVLELMNVNFLKVDKDEMILDYPTVEYLANIAAQPSGTLLHLTIQAWDFAGNWETYEANFTIGAPPPPPTRVLSVESTPIAGVPFNINGQSQTTPYSATLDEGDYTISVQEEITVDGITYIFERWSDGSTDTERTLTLAEDTTLTIEYEKASAAETGIPLWQIGIIAAVIAAVVAIIVIKTRKHG
ncbi:metallophosphoesterase [Candidatus Bathyarchaeota archaeon]|nr:metallophosphoesterase [Candidatus Bathyarchaeota archaeon]